KKYVTQSKKYYVHDPENLCNTGDVVSIMECRPKSKLKRWRLNKVEESAVEI
ncbi:MAG: 30S ribosomal protein S17, partial [Candidatus Marinimicrobia bacterium]|nr:30S ribosomal protein S17 [Candidatus Neomarinimicrobiota bacterium]